MSNQELVKDENLEAYGREAQNDAVQRMIKFVKGDYKCGEDEVPLGTVYLAHTRAWVKAWVHFVDKKVTERKIFRMILGERAPERDQIPDNDETQWPKDPAGKPQDPWSLQYLLPLEEMETGSVNIFTASSFGGRRAVGGLCDMWYKRTKREGKNGQPIIKLGVGTFPSKNWGDVKCPVFDVIGWDDSSTGVQAKEVDVEALKQGTSEQIMDDEIPF